MRNKHKFEGKPEMEKMNNIMINLSKTWAMAIINIYIKVKRCNSYTVKSIST